MIACKCGKVLEKVPTWLQGVQVEFICNACPNRKTKNIAFITLDSSLPATDKLDAPTDLSNEEDGQDGEAES